MKRKIISLLLALSLMFSMSCECFAIKDIAETNVVGNSIFQSIGDFFQSLFGGNEEEKSSYTFEQLSKMTNDEILKATTKASWEGIDGLYETTPITKEFYANQERMEALINGLVESGKKYTAKKDAGVCTLTDLICSGFYLADNNKTKELDYLNQRAFRNKCIPALLSIAENKNFKLGTETQDDVVNAFAKLISNTATDADVVNAAAKVLADYNQNFAKYSAEKGKRTILCALMNGICYDFERYCFEMKADAAAKTLWFGKIDSFIDEIATMAAVTDINDDNIDVVCNSIYNCGRLSDYHSDHAKIHKVVETVAKTQPEDSRQYFVAANAIKIAFNSKDSEGNAFSPKIKHANKKGGLLPRLYTFDDENITIETGDRVSEEKVQRLYWALKEVKSQFIRFIGNDKPLDPANADNKLKIVIYNNPTEYQNNAQVYGYSTDNGGIYMEGVGSFFTYERTNVDSIYSLEELFRHEYTHYLQGKYQTHGTFGEGPFYIAGGNFHRLTWFDEGMAEFFAGSTRFDVQPRNSMVGGLVSNNDEKMDLKKLLHASYDTDGFTFYKFGYAFVDYMYHNNMQIFWDFSDAMIADDVNSFDTVVDRLSNDAKEETAYKTHIDDMCKNISSYITPLVSNNYIKTIPTQELTQIQKDVNAAMGVETSEIKEMKSQFYNTFELKTQYTLTESTDKMTDWNKMNEIVNAALKTLDENSWAGYKTVTAYFANPTVNSDKQVVYDVVFHGIVSRTTEK
ncbi:MAG: collagenase [Oscillospiraceae bacterium]